MGEPRHVTREVLNLAASNMPIEVTGWVAELDDRPGWYELAAPPPAPEPEPAPKAKAKAAAKPAAAKKPAPTRRTTTKKPAARKK